METFHEQLVFSQTLFDYNTLVFRSIFLKFSGKTPDAIFLPQFSFRVVIFSLRGGIQIFVYVFPIYLNLFKTKLFYLWTPKNKFGAC